LAYLVFPSATHSRFEHSLGTFHVASLMVEKVKASIDKSLVKKVALVHDIGHMPFSHTFEDAVKILDVMEKGKNSLGKETSRKDQIEGEHADFKTAKFHEYMGIHILKDCM
jgi:HD superfamily phosphohydrolase